MKSRSRRPLWIAIAGVLATVAGPVAPVSAAPSTIQVVNTTSISPSATTLAAGDQLSIYACFQGEVARSGGADGDVKLILNSKTAGVAWAGARATSTPAIPGVTNNCLEFAYTVAGGDTSQVGLQASAITLANSATLTITGFDTISATPYNLSPAQNLCNAGPCGGGGSVQLAVDVTRRRGRQSHRQRRGESAPGSNLVLTTNERVVAGLSLQSRSCSSSTATVSLRAITTSSSEI